MKFRMKSDTVGVVVYKFTDADGTHHIYNTLAAVPEPYRVWFHSQQIARRWRVLRSVKISVPPHVADIRLTKDRPTVPRELTLYLPRPALYSAEQTAPLL